MSVADAFRNASSIVKISTLAFGLTFGNAAHAGMLYDQCIVFVVDSSTSTKPKGWQGQIQGIAAGLVDDEVVRKVNKMNAGIKAGFVAFAGRVEEMKSAHLYDTPSLERYAHYVRTMEPPVGGSNNLYGALKTARDIFARIRNEGHDCLYKTIDFSGDGADSFVSHKMIRALVTELAREGVTIHGLSFYDLVYKKYRAPDTQEWVQEDRNLFQNIHDYYEKVIVTPAGYGVSPGRLFTIDNQSDINTQASIIEQLAELMRVKLRFEVASPGDLVRARFAYDLNKNSVLAYQYR